MFSGNRQFNLLRKIVLGFIIFFSTSFGFISNTYAIDNSTKTEIKFGKIFQMFIVGQDENKTTVEEEKEACSYLENNPLKAKSLKELGDIFYFFLVDLILNGGLLAFMFYKMMDIYKEIRGEKVENAVIEKDTSKALISAILKHLKSVIGAILFYLIMLILLNSFTLTC